MCECISLYISPFLGDHHGGSTVLKNTVIFSATDFSEIIYRLTTRQLMVNIGHKSCENKQSIKAQFQFSEDLEAGGCEVTSSDIGAICETSGCDPDQVIGVLLELNILASIKLNPPPPISCKGVSKGLMITTKNKLPKYLFPLQNTLFSVISKRSAMKDSSFHLLLIFIVSNLSNAQKLI